MSIYQGKLLTIHKEAYLDWYQNLWLKIIFLS